MPVKTLTVNKFSAGSGTRSICSYLKINYRLSLSFKRKRNPPLPSIFQPPNIIHSLVYDSFKVLLKGIISKSVRLATPDLGKWCKGLTTESI